MLTRGYDSLQRNIKKQINEPVELSLNKPTPDMWDKILRAFKDALEKAEAAYLRRAQSEEYVNVP